VGVGTPTFYNRRAIVPKEMGGANINLRLGCGVNLMGYYMYVGGTNRVGEITTMESSGGRVSYDYQAPVGEFGNWGAAMKETRRYNYFMNDFGAGLAPAVAYLPTGNKDTSNLQWAVRLHENGGYLFCSNYLYKHPRRDYENVQFKINLKGESLEIPRNPVTVKNGVYFAWLFNQNLSGVSLKYAAAGLICKHRKADAETYFFFADDNLPGEYLIADDNIKDVKAQGAHVSREKKQYFVSRLAPGKDCVIEITRNDGNTVRFITLNKEESQSVWKGQIGGDDFVAFSESGLIYEDSGVTLVDESVNQEIEVYESDFANTPDSKKSGYYTQYRFTGKEDKPTARISKLSPMDGACIVAPSAGNSVQKIFEGTTLSSAETIILRYKTSGTANGFFNGKDIQSVDKGNYHEAELTAHFINGENTIRFQSEQENFTVIAEAEVLLKNGARRIWQTDNTWVSDDRKPVRVIGTPGQNGLPAIAWNGDENISYFRIETPELHGFQPEVRLNVSFSGDRANAYVGEKLINDFLFNGSDWIIGINRYADQLLSNPLVIRIKGFDTEDPPVYFEKGTDLKNCTTPVINRVLVKNEYRYCLKKGN
jgi:hypothetical protein